MHNPEIDGSSGSISEAFDAVSKAKIALDEARRNERQRLAAVALGEPAEGISPVELATALDKAQTALDAAEKLVEALKSEQEQAAQRLQWTTQSADDALRAVLRTAPEVLQLKNDVEIVRGALAATVGKLLSLPPGECGTIVWEIDSILNKTADPVWAAAVESLRFDADAKLLQ